MKGSRSENDELPRRVLRRRKKLCYNEGTLKKSQFTHRRKRHRSWDSGIKLRRSASLMRFRQCSRSSSVSSLESVVYLGRHKKIPPLIVLSDSSDDENELKTPKRKLRKLRSTNISYYAKPKKRRERKRNSVEQNSLHNEVDLLNMLREMRVDTSSMVSEVFRCTDMSECQH